MPFFSSVEPSAVPFFFRNFPAFSSQTFHTRPAATAYPSRRHRRRHCCLLQRQRRYMRLGRCHGTLEAECEGSIAHKFTFTSRRGAEQTEDVLTTRGDLVLVRLTHGVTRGYADARETGGLCRGSRVPATASRWSARGGSCLTSASAGSVAGGGGVVFVWTS